jgi:hypothetical protein
MRIGSVAVACLAVGIVAAPAEGHISMALGEACQLAVGRASSRLLRAVGRCVAECYAAGALPSECVPPFGGETEECIERAEHDAQERYGYPACLGHMPPCYQPTTEDQLGYVYDIVEDLFTQFTAQAIAPVFCDEAGGGDVLTDAEAQCRDDVAVVLGKLAAAEARCLNRCRKKEMKGDLDIGSCDASAVLDARTVQCLAKARAKADAALAGCTDPPECLAPVLPSLLGQVGTVLADADPDIYCAPVSPCGVLGQPQCNGACPAGQSCVADSTPPFCVCAASALPCGEEAAAPQCWGVCPAERPLCVDEDGICTCVPDL